MFRRVRKGMQLGVLVSLLALSASTVFGQDAPPVIPPEVSDHTQEWPLANMDYANTRNATSEISVDNINTLGMAWSFDIPAASYFGAVATNPIISDGVIYFETLTSHVYAMNLSDGSIVWDHDYAAENIGPNGVVAGWGKLFAVKGATSVAALDLATGDELWTIDLPLGETEGIDIQPTVYDGMVYVSSVPGVGVSNFYQGGGAGELFALNQETGEIAWQFNTVDSEDIWGNPDVNSGGGSWYPPAIDTESGMTYWSVANPAPWPGTEEFPNGSSRPGDNLYSNSLVQISGDAGELGWYTQVKPHDLFDLDLQLSPILGTAMVNGTEHNVVYTSGKLGTVYAMDRDTGEILWATDVGMHQNDHLQQVPEGQTIEVYPGSLGGVETPMALATDGILYVPLLNQPNYYLSTGLGESDADVPSTGELVAIDVNTGAILWKHDFNQPIYGGATISNDLVFTAAYDGTIYAFNRTTGDLVWQWTAPSGINGFGAIVGDTIVWPAGAGQTPQLIALRLGVGDPVGGVPEATAAPDMSGMDMTPEATAEVTTEDLSQYLTVDAATQTVNLTILAGQGSANGGLNFNGRDHGGATITVPEGYTVHVTFTNEGTMAHSAIVATTDQLQEVTITEPVFAGAATPNPNNGTAPGATDEFKFVADSQGEYALLCGIPGHGYAGQWLHFNVGASDVQPSFVISEPEAGSGAGTGV